MNILCRIGLHRRRGTNVTVREWDDEWGHHRDGQFLMQCTRVGCKKLTHYGELSIALGRSFSLAGARINKEKESD